MCNQKKQHKKDVKLLSEDAFEGAKKRIKELVSFLDDMKKNKRCIAKVKANFDSKWGYAGIKFIYGANMDTEVVNLVSYDLLKFMDDKGLIPSSDPDDLSADDLALYLALNYYDSDYDHYVHLESSEEYTSDIIFASDKIADLRSNTYIPTFIGILSDIDSDLYSIYYDMLKNIVDKLADEDEQTNKLKEKYKKYLNK